MNEQIGNKINDKTYIKLTPFKGFVLENFPFIEADFDAITNYQLLCKVIEYLNNVIANQNTVQELGTDLVNAYNSLVDAVNLAINEFETDVTADINQFKVDINDDFDEFTTNITTQFNNLQNYVNNYFDNNFPELVSDKLDEMAEDGTLENLLNDTAHLIKVYNTYADMMADSSTFTNGLKIKILGYYSIGDNGNSEYIVRTKTNEDITDGMFLINLSETLVIELIKNEIINIRQLGASENSVDNTPYINASLTNLQYAFIPIGTFNCSTQITLHANQTLYGEDKTNSILHYTNSNKFIITEDVSSCVKVSIHDLTITGTSKTGYGLFLERTTKVSDTWHRLYNLIVSSFEYGVYLSKNLNEIQISDIVTRDCQYGIYIINLNDFYIERCVSCVNTKHGIYISNSTEGRISDIKSWYNGSDNASNYYNIYITSGLALMINNISCQESYGNNLRLSYSKNLSITNCYLSLPSLDGNEHFQLYMEHLQDSNLNAICADKKVDGTYINKIISATSDNLRNNINMIVENDFPSDKIIAQQNNNNSYAFNLKNNIKVNNTLVNFYNNYNYIVNGDLSNNSDITRFITAGRDYCSIVNNKLRINNNTAAAVTITFNHPTLPETGLYTFYIKFKKVSGTGRVITQYSGYKDVTADTTTEEELFSSYAFNKTSTAAATNINLSIPAGLTIDVEEIGLCAGITCNTNNPLYKTAILS